MARIKKKVIRQNSGDTNTVASLNAWLAQQAKQDTLRFITCGSVDDGKSTLIGRLLWESQNIYDDQLAALVHDSKRHGTQGEAIDFALLVDGLSAEREQGITIDVAYRFFSTPLRKFIVADTPGHEQYTRNMVTGASTADLAVILIDARQGMVTQTRRHSWLASLMGIRHVVLAINKMDLVSFSLETFKAIETDFLNLAASFQFKSVTAIPVSALLGDNIINRSERTPWFTGPTLLSHLQTVRISPPEDNRFVFPVQWVNRPSSEFRGLCGTVASGHITVGDLVRVTASGQAANVQRIVTHDGDLSQAHAGEAITLVLDKEIDASRGDILAVADSPLEMTDQFEATLIWMHAETGLVGRRYDMKLLNQWTTSAFTSIKYRINVNTLGFEACKQLSLNDIAICKFALSRPVVFDSYSRSAALGSFILVDRFSQATVAAGLITHSLRRAQNVHHQTLSISRQDREHLNNHKGKVIWFTGLSGSGKSTLANALEVELHGRGMRTYILDGDNVRQGLNRDLGFTEADRVENIRRIAEVAKLMMDAGLIVMTAFISPFKREREMARELIGQENFIEVHVSTPLETCEQRDVKGLYKKARAGEIPNMTGINSPYELPDRPDYIIDTTVTPITQSIRDLSSLVLKK